LDRHWNKNWQIKLLKMLLCSLEILLFFVVFLNFYTPGGLDPVDYKQANCKALEYYYHRQYQNKNHHN